METIAEFRSWLIEQFDRVVEYMAFPEPDEQIWDWYPEVVQEAGDLAGLLGWDDLCQRSFEFKYGDGAKGAKLFLSACIARCNEPSPAVAPTSNAAVPTSDNPKHRTTEEKVALAIALLYNHPDWSKTQIAKHVGVDRRTLYNWPKFVAVWNVFKAKDTSGIARGHKNKGKIEAYSAATKCASCGDIATEEFDGRDFCRECFLERVQEEQDAELSKDKRAGGR